jgi:hypothetical protein
LILREARVEVDGGSATVSMAWQRGWRQRDSVNSLRKRTAAVRSEVGVKAVARSEVEVEAVACSEAGIETIGGGGTMVSRAIEEWERESRVEKLLSVARESAGLEILGWGT